MRALRPDSIAIYAVLRRVRRIMHIRIVAMGSARNYNNTSFGSCYKAVTSPPDTAIRPFIEAYSISRWEIKDDPIGNVGPVLGALR